MVRLESLASGRAPKLNSTPIPIRCRRTSSATTSGMFSMARMRSSSGFDGRDAALVDGGGVHAGGIGIADLLIERAALLAYDGGALQDIQQDLFVVGAQFGEAAPAGAVGGQRVFGNPVSAGVLVEIHAGVDGLVHGGRIQTGGGFRLREGATHTKEGSQE